jgi:hypothetical protein
MVVGDSVALTMGIEMNIDEENWGSVLETNATLGCAFLTGYDIVENNKPEQLNRACSSIVDTWVKENTVFKAQAIVVEMGWWDSQIHVVNGQVVGLMIPSYQNLVRSRIISFVQAMQHGTTLPIYFLSVPWMSPPPWPGGGENPAAWPAYHYEMNSLLKQAVSATHNTHFIDVSPAITPSGHYQEYADGGRCRETDGVHLYTGSSSATLTFVSTPCGRALQRDVLSTIRRALAGG